MGLASGETPADMWPEARPPINGVFQDKSIISIEQYTREDIEQVLHVAAHLEAHREQRAAPRELLGGLVVKAVMFEGSSRTAGSYLSAAAYLGASAQQPNLDTSSKTKGESDIETVRCFAGQADALLIRHSQAGFMEQVAERIDTPFHNGGSPGEHFSQTLKDLYTMHKRYGSIDGLRVTIAGDVARYRAAISLVKALSLFDNVDLVVASPSFSKIPAEVIDMAAQQGMAIEETEDLRPRLQGPGVNYICRPPKEYDGPDKDRHQAVLAAYETNGYNISQASMASAHPGADIFHPLPHTGEISDDFYRNPRAVYFEQEDNGVPIHMANLALQLAETKVRLLYPTPSAQARLQVARRVA